MPSKPIKSILKTDSRGSSGSENLSSMDSLLENSSDTPPSEKVLMTRSDETGPRTRFVFTERNENTFYSNKIPAKLKQIEKYATLRIRKPRLKGTIPNEESQSASTSTSSDTKSSPEDQRLLSVDLTNGNDIMTKSMSFLERTNTPNSNAPNGSSLVRQGSLRVRKPSPGWEPCATRTTALRMAKMLESKAKITNSDRAGSCNSGSGESIHNSPTVHHLRPMQPVTPKTRESTPKSQGIGSKVFSKLSSAFGQTASSAQKRIRQDRGVQTELSMLKKGTDVVDHISFTPVHNSPIPSDENNSIGDDVEINPFEQIKHLQLLVSKYKNKSSKYQRAFEVVQMENLELSNQIRDLQIESKELTSFLQDEKSALAESLNEAEAKILELQNNLKLYTEESEARCLNLKKLCDQYKQEAFASYALLNRLESDSDIVIPTEPPCAKNNGTHFDIRT